MARVEVIIVGPDGAPFVTNKVTAISVSTGP